MGDAYYVVDLTFEVVAPHYDPDRLPRVAGQFARLLPDGSQTLKIASTGGTGMAEFSARVPDRGGMARALFDVVTALELAIAKETADVASLGEICSAVVKRLPCGV